MSTSRNSSLSWQTGLGLAVALGGPPAIVWIERLQFGKMPGIGVQAFFQLVFCSLAVFIVLVVLRWECLPLQSIGLRRPGWSTAGMALLLTLVCFLVQPAIAPLVKIFGQAGADSSVARMAVWPVWFRLFVGITSGFVEEMLYRGYAIERLTAITGNQWLGATLATVAFAAAHIPFWGAGFALAADLPAGVIFVLFYLWRRDLLANGLSHSVMLIVAFFTTVPLDV